MRCNTKNSQPLVLKANILLHVLLLGFACLFATIANAQATENSSNGLFDREEVLTLKLSGEIQKLLKDRGDDMQYHSITLSYLAADSNKVSFPIRAKTRGHFRRTQGNCRYPPLMLNFSKGETPENSIFTGQDKLKLVTPCTDDKYVVNEYLVYKLFNLISEKSFKARLVHVIYDDNGKESKPQYGILLEQEDDMARRNNAVIIEDKLVRPEQTKGEDFLKMAVFEYL